MRGLSQPASPPNRESIDGGDEFVATLKSELSRLRCRVKDLNLENDRLQELSQAREDLYNEEIVRNAILRSREAVLEAKLEELQSISLASASLSDCKNADENTELAERVRNLEQENDNLTSQLSSCLQLLGAGTAPRSGTCGQRAFSEEPVQPIIDSQFDGPPTTAFDTSSGDHLPNMPSLEPSHSSKVVAPSGNDNLPADAAHEVNSRTESTAGAPSIRLIRDCFKDPLEGNSIQIQPSPSSTLGVNKGIVSVVRDLHSCHLAKAQFSHELLQLASHGLKALHKSLEEAHRMINFGDSGHASGAAFIAPLPVVQSSHTTGKDINDQGSSDPVQLQEKCLLSPVQERGSLSGPLSAKYATDNESVHGPAVLNLTKPSFRDTDQRKEHMLLAVYEPYLQRAQIQLASVDQRKGSILPRLQQSKSELNSCSVASIVVIGHSTSTILENFSSGVAQRISAWRELLKVALSQMHTVARAADLLDERHTANSRKSFEIRDSFSRKKQQLHPPASSRKRNISRVRVDSTGMYQDYSRQCPADCVKGTTKTIGSTTPNIEPYCIRAGPELSTESDCPMVKSHPGANIDHGVQSLLDGFAHDTREARSECVVLRQMLVLGQQSQRQLVDDVQKRVDNLTSSLDVAKIEKARAKSENENLHAMLEAIIIEKETLHSNQARLEELIVEQRATSEQNVALTQQVHALREEVSYGQNQLQLASEELLTHVRELRQAQESFRESCEEKKLLECRIRKIEGFSHRYQMVASTLESMWCNFNRRLCDLNIGDWENASPQLCQLRSLMLSATSRDDPNAKVHNEGLEDAETSPVSKSGDELLAKSQGHMEVALQLYDVLFNELLTAIKQNAVVTNRIQFDHEGTRHVCQQLDQAFIGLQSQEQRVEGEISKFIRRAQQIETMLKVVQEGKADEGSRSIDNELTRICQTEAQQLRRDLVEANSPRAHGVPILPRPYSISDHIDEPKEHSSLQEKLQEQQTTIDFERHQNEDLNDRYQQRCKELLILDKRYRKLLSAYQKLREQDTSPSPPKASQDTNANAVGSALPTYTSHTHNRQPVDGEEGHCQQQ
ncbi:hypothetical protein DFS34DRAFT_626024 [Phlyctochytrium arcticum]|nr:hypothetical protein DFS34DRAFT_626024 [Phlyctochytrium arcticum]